MEGPPWRWGWRGKRRGRRGRPPKPRRIEWGYGVLAYRLAKPGEELGGDPVLLAVDELEALRLVYLEGFSQEDAARRMGVSRGTLWRLLDSGRRKLVQAIVEKRPLVVVGEEVLG